MHMTHCFDAIRQVSLSSQRATGGIFEDFRMRAHEFDSRYNATQIARRYIRLVTSP